MAGDTGRKCSKGHVMDPNWDSCPYCEAQERSNQKSSVAEGKPTIVQESVPNNNIPERRTIVGDMPAPSPGRETLVAASNGIAGTTSNNPANDTRKIVGVLISYSWVPGGKIYAIREGKNYIGKGDASGQSSDIQVPQDARMSSVHALILYRSGKCEIIDQASSNGTFLNDEIIPANLSVELNNHAEFKTGSTLWTFIKIDSPTAS